MLPIEKDRRFPWLVMSESLLPSATEYISKGWSLKDVRERGLPAGRKRGYVLDSDVGSEEELLKLSYYRNFLRPHGIGGFCAILFDIQGIEWAMSIQLRRGTFVPDDDKLALIPEIRSRLEVAAQACSARVSQQWDSHFESAGFQGNGMAVLDPGGSVLRSNRDFDVLLKVARPNESAKKFSSQFILPCLEQFCAPGEVAHQPVPYLIGDDERLLSCSVRRIPDHVRLFSTEGIAVVTITQHSSLTDDFSRILTDKYGLVQSEIELALEICNGSRIRQAATHLGIAESTARQRLKAIYRKTGAGTQHQLLAYVLRARALLPNLPGKS